MKYSLTLLLLFAIYLTTAQDIIYKKDGQRISSSVLSIKNGNINYQLYQSRDNTIKKLPTIEVSMIDFEDKGIEFINENTEYSNTNIKQPNENPGISNNKNQGNTSETFDKIVKANGESIDVIITDIFSETVKYRYSNQPTGPIRSAPVSDIKKIIYANGEEKVFNQEEPIAGYPEYNAPNNQKIEPDYTVPPANDSYSKEKLITTFGIGAGYGNSYGGAGLKAQILFGKNNFKIGLHGGAGYYFDEFNFVANKVFAYSAGLQVYFWKGLYIDAQYGGFGMYKRINKEYDALTGISSLIGYDFKINKKILLNLAGGIAYDLNAGNKIWYSFDAGISYFFTL